MDASNDDWRERNSPRHLLPPQSVAARMHGETTAAITHVVSDDESAAPSETKSEASMMVLMRYMGLTSKKYMEKPKPMAPDVQFIHDLREGDHVIRWKMLGYCYPIQVHGIVYSAGPDFVTLVDFSLASYSDVDKAGNCVEQDRKVNKTRRRMNILTLSDEKEIKKWSKIRYGEEVELKVHSSNEEMQQNINEEDLMNAGARANMTDGVEESPSAGLELEEVEKCIEAKIKTTPEKRSPRSPKKSPSSSWFWSCSSPDSTVQDEECAPKPKPKPPSPSKENPQKLRLPNADPARLVLARLRFLLEYGEQRWPPSNNANSDDDDREKEARPNLLPPPHLLYANSECIAVFCKTGGWSTLQASIFLHSSTVGNAKQTATAALYLSAQTVTVPASGFWGLFGGTTTISLFTAQPWLVPALVGGGMVYVGLPTFMLWKARGRWAETERRLNAAFGSIYDPKAVAEFPVSRQLEWNWA